MKKNILIIGGYGLSGFPVSKTLLAHTDYNVILAGRNIEKASKSAGSLNRIFNGNRASGLFIDIEKPETCLTAFKTADLLIICMTNNKFIKEIALNAIESHINCISLNLTDTDKITIQSLSGDFIKNNCSFIIDSNFADIISELAFNISSLKKSCREIKAFINLKDGFFSKEIYDLINNKPWNKVEFLSLKNGISAALLINDIPYSIRDFSGLKLSYDVSAIPVVACLKQCINGLILKPGIWNICDIINYQVFHSDIEAMGIDIRVTAK